MRIAVPRLLPRRADGARLERLSATSLALLQRCPELWRRRYLALERPPRTPAQHLGLAVDAAAAAAWHARMAGETLDAEGARAVYESAFAAGEPVAWGAERAEALRAAGAGALAVYLAEALPTLRPRAVQRRFDLRLDPDLGWWLVGVIDLETEREVIDLKVKARHLGPAGAEASLQAGLYLAVRRAEGPPAERFLFHSLRHGANPSLRVIPTARDARRLDGALARVAMGARLIADLAARHGAEGPWPLADPESWACSARYCPAWAECPGGAGPA